jgi:hypothetical protein
MRSIPVAIALAAIITPALAVADDDEPVTAPAPRRRPA